MAIGKQELDFKSWQDIKAQRSSKTLALVIPMDNFRCQSCCLGNTVPPAPQEEGKPVLTLTLRVPWLLWERPGLG